MQDQEKPNRIAAYLLFLARQRRPLVVAVFVAILGFVVLVVRPDLSVFFGRPYDIPPIGLATVLWGFAISLALSDYLKGPAETIEASRPGRVFDDLVALNHRLALLELHWTERSNADVAALVGNREGIIQELRESLSASVADSLVKQFEPTLLANAREQQIRSAFLQAQQRMYREVEVLGRRARLNLVFGVLTTGVAILLLAYMVLWHERQFVDLTALLSHYVPRVTVVVFVEVFSFFFLRLYRATLGEIHTYQNDLTRLALQQVAVDAAWAAPDHAVRGTLAKDLLTTSEKASSGSRVDDKAVDPAAVLDLMERFGKLVEKGKKPGKTE
ncbi:hypothetical protein [Variovorax sp. J22R115]|uniref:hypothetical protein n=1 Tax=Variovorax sp. J22R115 TaxID=3053509 RepID=UPI002576A5BF|nr:hypothetical protein [Variovorax sp. J22R115]MDM0050922.1 hypothetical protein [Variovorax sp. J22R115]